MVNFDQINTFSSKLQVSRETIISLKKYEELLIENNKNLNLIGKSTINEIWIRHFLDSAQLIDFIEENDKSLIDIGTGAGFPGIVIAILCKNKKKNIKIKLIEKSILKVKFLNKVIDELKLDVSVDTVNVLNSSDKYKYDIITARAFKPLEIILPFLHKKIANWKKIFLFLGKTGQKELLNASKIWDIEYKQSMSITSSDSSIIEINNLKRK